jgi:hypothetical protein
MMTLVAIRKNADFVREGEAIPVVQASPITAATLTPKKIKAIILATSELFANPDAEDLVRSVLIEATGPALDRAVFSTAAATAERPAGLFNGIPPIPSTGDMIDDLVRLASAVAVVAGNGPIAFVAAPA